MSESLEHIDPVQFPILAKLKVRSVDSEWQTPSDYFSQMESEIVWQANSDQTEWAVPDNYFDHMLDEVVSKSEFDIDSDAFFQSQAAEISLKSRLVEAKEEWQVPDDYFADLEERITANAEVENAKKAGLSVHLKTWVAIAAAACVAFGIVMFQRPDAPVAVETSFADLLTNSPLTEEETLDWIEEDVMEEWIIEQLDSLPPDTLEPQPMPPPKKMVDPKPTNKGGQQKKEGPGKKQTPKKEVNFDELTEDEIIEYLLEEGGLQMDDL